MSNPNDKVKNEGEGEGDSAGGLVDLGLDEETDEDKLAEIVEQEEKCLQDLKKKTPTKKFWKKNVTLWNLYFWLQWMLSIKPKRN